MGVGKQRGFTLIELLVVMAIMGILAAAAMPLAETMVTAQKERNLRLALREIRTALDQYHNLAVLYPNVLIATTSGYPPKLQTLVDGVPDPRPGFSGARYYFLRQIPRDPFAAAQLPPELTWQLRSYASPAAKPQPGADVYDVHSASTAQALDGSMYASW